MPLLSSFVSCLSFLATLGAAWPDFTGRPVVGGYWPVYEANNISVEDIPYDLLNHIDYFVAETLPNRSIDISGGMPLDFAEEQIKMLINNAHRYGVSVSLTLGGYYGSSYFTSNVATAENRTLYAESIAKVLRQYGFDGLDIDWEFPNEPNSGVVSGTNNTYTNEYSPEDAPNLIDWLASLRAVLGTSSARLSATINAAGWLGANNKSLTDYSPFAVNLDYLTIMLYDTYIPSISTTTGPNAPLYSQCDVDNPYSVDYAVQFFTKAGFPADHIILAVPGYGHEFITESSTLTTQEISGYKTKMYQRNSQTSPTYTSPTYNQLIDFGFLSADGKEGQGGYTRYWDECTDTPFIFNPSTKSFISYDDTRSLKLKAEYAKSRGIAGVTLFDLSDDTPDSILLEALNSVIPAKKHASTSAAPEPTSTSASSSKLLLKQPEARNATVSLPSHFATDSLAELLEDACHAADQGAAPPVLGHNTRHGLYLEEDLGSAGQDAKSARACD